MSHWTVDNAAERYVDLKDHLEDLHSELDSAYSAQDFAWAETVYTQIIQARNEINALVEHFGFEK
jgi:hypothetical protein